MRVLGRVAEAGLALASVVAALLLVEGWVGALRRVIAARRRPAAPLPDRGGVPPTVTILVPAWEEAATIRACIDALAAIDYPSWEAIIVAGGRDGTLEVARAAIADRPRFRVVEQEPRGKPAALNVGLAEATGDVVAIVDADTRVTSGWLKALVAPLGGSVGGPEAPRVGASTGEFLPARSTAVSRAELMERIDVYLVRGAAHLQGSGTIAVERALLDELGGFPVDSFADDWELDARLAERGTARAHAPDALVTTERPATLAEYWRNELRWRRGHLTSVRRLSGHFLGDPLTTARTLLPYLVAWGTVAAAALAAAATALAAAAGGLAAPAPRSRRPLVLWAAFVAAVVLRPLALVAEVVAYTRDARWIRDAWAVPVLWVVTLAASLIASATQGRATLDFKGPRPVREDGRTSPAAEVAPPRGTAPAGRGDGD